MIQQLEESPSLIQMMIKKAKKNNQGKKVQWDFGESTQKELKSIGSSISNNVLTIKVYGFAQRFLRTMSIGMSKRKWNFYSNNKRKKKRPKNKRSVTDWKKKNMKETNKNILANVQDKKNHAVVAQLK